ncbi:Hypothetical_protein [Hexamita inflata]|uniref:Hypothetical_protein n=1 Tax=Hexamita inflata TaxID=28002 RepID=A0AA86UG98_9EUKA|nr:Hypothetical protein HINF_LOCUS42314 [Hexamita inflata]
MPTQQRSNRALTESSADQFYLIRQLNFQKLSFSLFVISLGLHGRLFRCIGIAWWWLPLMHCFINLIRYLGSFLVYLILQIPNFGVYCRWQISYFLGFSCFDIFLSSLLLDKLFLIFFNLLLLLSFRQDWLGFLFCVSYRFLFILTIFWLFDRLFQDRLFILFHFLSFLLRRLCVRLGHFSGLLIL